MRLIELGNYRSLKNSREENTLCRGMLGHESLRIGRKTAFNDGFVRERTFRVSKSRIIQARIAVFDRHSNLVKTDGATPAVVQRQLRHRDPRITLGVYGHVVGDQRRDAVENRSARTAKFAVN